MAYTSFTPLFKTQEGQDAAAIRIWDQSTWNGESALTTFCVVRLTYFLSDGTSVVYDDYELITGADTTKFDEYLDQDGHIIDIADLRISGAVADERFTDGYYLVQIVYSDGTYAVGSEPYYDNYQAFLASARCKARKLPTKLSWPFVDDTYRINRDIYLQRMYLDSAEDAADLGEENKFRYIMDLVNDIFTFYEISNCF